MLSDPVAEAFGLIHRHPSGENFWHGLVHFQKFHVTQPSQSEISRDSTKPMKTIAEQENNFWKDCEKRYSLIKLLKDTSKRMNLDETCVKTLNGKIYLYIYSD